MKDYYIITDGQGNFVFFDMQVNEIKFDNKVARRSGMAYDMEGAQKLKEKAFRMYATRLAAAAERNEEFQNRTRKDYPLHFSNEQIANGKIQSQKNFDELLDKKFSIVKVTYEVLK